MLEEFMEVLRREREKWLEESKRRHELVTERLRTYERIMDSKESSEAQNVKAFLQKVIVLESEERKTYELIILSDILVLANYVEIIHFGIMRLEDEFEGVEEMKERKNEIDNLVKLLKTYYADVQKIRESRTEALDYVS